LRPVLLRNGEKDSMRTTKLVTVSLPPRLLKDAERVAKEERRTRSELVREAIREYIATRRWRRIRRWGEAAARRAGVRNEEGIERVVEAYRHGKRQVPRIVLDTNVYISAFLFGGVPGALIAVARAGVAELRVSPVLRLYARPGGGGPARNPEFGSTHHPGSTPRGDPGGRAG